MNHESEWLKISDYLLEINERIMKIRALAIGLHIPESIVTQLAAAAIHHAFFSRDLYEYKKNKKVKPKSKLEEKFHNECGCKGQVIQ